MTLEASSDGIYQAGSYYEYIKSVIETSLNHFLADTEFPYADGNSRGFGGGNFGGFGRPSGDAGGDREFLGMDGNMPDANFIAWVNACLR